MFAQGDVIENTSGKKLVRKYYTGIAPVQVVDINPNEQRMLELYPDPGKLNYEYTGTSDSGTAFAKIRVCLYLTDAANNFPLLLEFRVYNAAAMTRDEKKVQVIDKYGRTAWAWKEHVRNHNYPLESTKNAQPMKIDESYRFAYQGEERLTKFLRTWLGIRSIYSVAKRDDAKPSDFQACICRLEHPKDLFNGNFSEITDLVKGKDKGGMPYIDHQFNVLLGVKEKEGKWLDQVVFDYIIPGWSDSLDYINKELNAAQSLGRFAGVKFDLFKPYKEYVKEDTPLVKNDPLLKFEKPSTNNEINEEDLPF